LGKTRAKIGLEEAVAALVELEKPLKPVKERLEEWD
jgi:hypothetical protein